MTAARALERLYAVPPKDFTRARNSLAAELRKARDTDAASTIARLRRPSATLWAVNQLAHHASASLQRFLEAVDRLRRTQLSDPRGAMEAMRAERAQLEALVARAEQALSEAGYSPSAEARRRIGDTLLGAAADRRHAEALVHGRLTEELQAPGFDALTGGTRLRLVQGGAGSRDGGEQRRMAVTPRRGDRETKTAARGTKMRGDDARARERDEARADERDDARAREREARDRERAAKAEARAAQVEARRREAAERAAAVESLEREAAEARERLADIQRRLKEARRGRNAR
ncbi:MAG TPA: hypothetical protein VGL14_23605 [Methylomirabilota bacterium]